MTKGTFFGLNKLLMGGVFFILAPINLLLAFTVLKSSLPKPRSQSVIKNTSYLGVYAALPNEKGTLSFNIIPGDARPVIIRQYLARYHSPLEPYADYIFTISQKYNLDYRLLVAIAQQESNLGKKIPANSYNAWGWGVHSRGTLKFSNWEEAIEAVARGLRENYLNKGLITPEEIMSVYTPLSNGSWASGVRQFMGEME